MKIKEMIIPIFSLLCMLLFLWFGISNIQRTTATKEKEGIENAIYRSVMHCYATEGRYPENIAYLEEHYGVSYDKDKYIIRYEIFADNIIPQIWVVNID